MTRDRGRRLSHRAIVGLVAVLAIGVAVTLVIREAVRRAREEALIERLLASTSDDERSEIAVSLAEMRSERGLEAMLTVLDRNDSPANLAYLRMSGEAMSRPGGEYERVAIAGPGPPAAGAGAWTLEPVSGGVVDAAWAAPAIEIFGSSAAETILEFLLERAVCASGFERGTELVEGISGVTLRPVLDAFDGPGSTRSRRAAWILERLAPRLTPGERARIVAGLAEGTDVERRILCARILARSLPDGEVASREGEEVAVIEALERGLRDPADGVVAECARGLGLAGSGALSARETLLTVATDAGRSASVRARAVWALGLSQDRSLLGPLRELRSTLSGTPDPGLSEALTNAIEQLEGDFD